VTALLLLPPAAGCRAPSADRAEGSPARAAADDTAASRRAIERTVRRYVEASRAGDAGALAALYADDAAVLPPAHAPVLGREAIAEFWREGLEPGFDLEPLRIDVHGDVAYLVGRYTLPATAAEPADTGKSVMGLRRSADGRWHVEVDIWNHSTGEENDRGPEPEPRPLVTPVVESRGSRVEAPGRSGSTGSGHAPT
jgi:uncharacterized protein (TIGR02246 family)